MGQSRQDEVDTTRDGMCGSARTRRAAGALLLALTCLFAGGCAAVPQNTVDEILKPSNRRNWKASMAVLPYARFRDDQVTVYNVRNCTYLDEETYVLHYEDRGYDLDELESVDLIVCPFPSTPRLAHTMLSFGFRDGRYLGVSVEVRLEEGESYSAVGGTIRQFEIMYVVADERDLIQLRTDVRKTDVYVYRVRATPEQVRALFVDVMKRVNTLRKRPEFYDTIMNNCTTNIVAHVNRIRPGTIPWQPTSILTGLADREAYRLGLLVDYGSFEETKRHAHVNPRAERYANTPQFSAWIRSDPQGTRTVQRDPGFLAR
ncbi:MAG: DUF4105 domain-containing protein [Pirellulaceae bacterium]|jgi:hypothetical protein|nr:DUF4105 domain-containing protein [Pirellulaceae bacterium]